MKFLSAAWSAVRSLFAVYTGSGKSNGGLSPEKEAVSAVFLPLLGLAVGLLSTLALRLFQGYFSIEALAVTGLAVLLIFGGVGRFRSVSALFSEANRSTGPAAAAVIVLLFETFVLIQLGSVWGFNVMRSALVCMPVIGALAMVSAASAQRSEVSAVLPLSGVKAWHMLASASLAFVLMLPVFGLRSFVYASSAVLAGALTAAALQKHDKKEEAACVAAVISELLFLILLVVFQGNPIVYY